MRLLLDTHIVIAISRGDIDKRYPSILRAMADADTETFASAASLWEIAIKTRLGKLDAKIALKDLPILLESLEIPIVSVLPRHAVTFARPEPTTHDPFDRMLLVQCAIEEFKLATQDRELLKHPLAWRGLA